jgi:glycosyltransferase involved in cell wall biosynthesis
MSDPSITIVLPIHNGARYLDEAVASLVSQTLQDWELVIVDDASTDATAELIESWERKDARIRSLHLDRNAGLPAALNAGFALARGRYLTWTSDDNAFRPDALAELRRALESQPRADVVYSGFTEIDPDGTTLREVQARPPEPLVTGNRIGACFLYRREVDAALGGYDESLFLAEDYDFWLRASLRFTLRAVDRSLYIYRRHPESLSATRSEQVEAAARRAVEQHLLRLERGERGRALLTLAIHDYANQRSISGRRHLLRAIGCGRLPLSHGFRWVLLDALCGSRIATALRRACSSGAEASG